jgi:hypothetical protein
MARKKTDGARMGKTAKNERIKLKATYFNNCSVGLLLAGTLLPIVAAYRDIADIKHNVQSLLIGTASLRDADIFQGLTIVGGITSAFIIAMLLRSEADKLLKSLED